MDGQGKRRMDAKTWWYYYKGYVIVGILILCGASLTVWEKVTAKKPDLSAVVITDPVLSKEETNLLKDQLSRILWDFNGDGEVLLEEHAYGKNPAQAVLGAETSLYASASEVELIGDIQSCESYLFLTDNPRSLQRNYQFLARPDGTCPAQNDYSAEGKTLFLRDCPGIESREKGSKESQALSDLSDFQDFPDLLDLSAGRRCFYDEKSCRNPEACEEYWRKLTGTAQALF